MDFLLLYFFRRYIRRTWRFVKLKRLLFLSIVILFLLSTISFFYPLPGGTEDAVMFRDASALSLNFNPGTEAFLSFSGFIKNFSFLREFALYLIPTTLLSWILIDLFQNPIRTQIQQLIYSTFLLIPALYLFGTIPLRESYQLFFFYFLIKNIKEGNKIKYFYSVALAMFHKGLLIFSPLVLIRKLGVFLLVLCVLWLSSSWLISYIPESRGFELIEVVLNNNIINYVKNYRNSLELLSSSTMYLIEDKSTFSYLIKIFMSYQLGPIYFLDSVNIIFFIDSIWRCTLFLILIFKWKKVNKRIFILFIVISLIWSLGTVNYGQLIRHHMMHDFLLLILLNDTYKPYRNYASKEVRG